MRTRYCKIDGCGVELVVGENWYPSDRKNGNYICKDCRAEITRSWREKNPEKTRAQRTRANRKMGKLPMDESKDSSSYLGVYVAEGVLRHYFKNDVQVMSYGNPGYDFICNRDKLIDVKSSCLRKDGRWTFNINLNTTADYFLCVAYDNRNDLNIMHVWMIPGNKVNHLKGLTISPSTVHKWDKYIYDIEGFSTCCNAMKNAI